AGDAASAAVLRVVEDVYRTAVRGAAAAGCPAVRAEPAAAAAIGIAEGGHHVGQVANEVFRTGLAVEPEPPRASAILIIMAIVFRGAPITILTVRSLLPSLARRVANVVL